MDALADVWHRLRSLLWKNSEPVTRTLIAINVLTFVVYFIAVYFAGVDNPWRPLVYLTRIAWQEPWSFLTYPLVTYDPLSLIFAGYWLWFVGGSLERAWTSRTFARFFAGVALATSLGLWVGSWLLGFAKPGMLGSTQAALIGLWMPLGALTVSWCLLNPEQVVLLGFILPVPGRQLMWVTIVLTYIFFVMSFGAPWLGFFALTGVGVAYFYTRRRTQSFAHRLYANRGLRSPTIFERTLDWLAFYWERFRRRRPRR